MNTTDLPYTIEPCVAMAPFPATSVGDIEMCCEGAARVQRDIIGGGGGGVPVVATICLQSLGKIYHISNYLIVRHLVWPPVAHKAHFSDLSS